MLSSSHVPESIHIETFPIEMYPEIEQGKMVGLIEGEGSFVAVLSRSDMVEDLEAPPEERIYKYNYLVPRFSFTMTSIPVVEEVRKALNLRRPVKLPPTDQKPRYELMASPVATLEIAEWIRPYLTEGGDKDIQVKAMLTVFSRERPSIKITTEQAQALLPIRKEERWRTLLQWRRSGEI